MTAVGTALGTWLFYGFDALVSGLRWLIEIVWTPVSVPAVVVVFLTVGTGVGIWKLRGEHWPASEESEGSETNGSGTVSIDDLTDVQRNILGAFAASERRQLRLHALDEGLSPGSFQLEQAAAELCELGVLQVAEENVDDPLYQLADLGRALIVETEEEALSEVGNDGDGSTHALTPEDLTELQANILKLYVALEGGTFYSLELAEILEVNRLEVDTALTDLKAKGLIRSVRGGRLGTKYGLTEAGKSFLVRHGFTE